MALKEAKNNVAKNCKEQLSLVSVKETMQLLSGNGKCRLSPFS